MAPLRVDHLALLGVPPISLDQLEQTETLPLIVPTALEPEARSAFVRRWAEALSKFAPLLTDEETRLLRRPLTCASGGKPAILDAGENSDAARELARTRAKYPRKPDSWIRHQVAKQIQRRKTELQLDSIKKQLRRIELAQREREKQVRQSQAREAQARVRLEALPITALETRSD